MARIWFVVRETAAAAVALVPVCCLLHLFVFRSWRKSLPYGLFALYLAAVWALVGLPNVTYVRFGCNLNLIPLAGILGDLKNAVLNVALFVPLGVFLPLLWRDLGRLGPAVSFGFCTSLAIELLQLFTLRATDVNDLITNTLGTCLGILIAGGLGRRFPGLVGNGTKKERTFLLTAVAAVMFFAYPFLSDWAWKLTQ